MSTATEPKPVVFGQPQDVRGLPNAIELFQAGSWETPYHGTFEITIDDIDDTIKNFNAGIYRVNGTEPLPGTLDHLGGGSPAAFRITNIYRVEDSLMADVTWTELGKEMLARDEYRYISAEFNPRAFPFVNPENAGDQLVNVLTAATLTNDPLFKKLKPVLASAKAGVSDKRKGEISMDLAALRAKKKDELKEDELAFLKEHEADLNDEERKEFGFVETKAEEKTDDKADDASDEETKDDESDDTKTEEKTDVKASAGVKGTVTITQAELEQLRAGAAAGVAAKTELLKTQLTASVKEHVARGAIKSDQADEAVELLMASSEGNRSRLEKFLTALPSNENVTAGAKGSADDAKDNSTELTEAEKEYAKDFNLTEDEVKAYKAEKANK